MDRQLAAAVRAAIQEQTQYVVSLTNQYRDELDRIVSRAAARVNAELGASLERQGGKLIRSARNRSKLRQLDRDFMRALETEGYTRLTTEFLASFDNAMPSMQRTLALVTANSDSPLPAWSASDIRYLAGVKADYLYTLRGAVEDAAKTAKRNALFSVSALSVGELTSSISAIYSRSVGESATLATTAISTFYREMNDRMFRRLEQRGELRYTLAGPLDDLTRAWCRRRLRQARNGRTWTRAEIDAMIHDADRGVRQPPNVMVTCGGYNCRHLWLIARKS